MSKRCRGEVQAHRGRSAHSTARRRGVHSRGRPGRQGAPSVLPPDACRRWPADCARSLARSRHCRSPVLAAGPSGPAPWSAHVRSRGAALRPARPGVWPLRPRPVVVSGFDPPAAPWGSGHRGVDLLGRAGPTGARRARRHGHVRRHAGRPRRRGRRPRRRPHHLRTGRGRGRAPGGSVGAGQRRRHLQLGRQPLLPARVPALGAAARRDLPRPAAARRASAPVRLLPLRRASVPAPTALGPPVAAMRLRVGQLGRPGAAGRW